jgi:hypothetical protein
MVVESPLKKNSKLRNSAAFIRRMMNDVKRRENREKKFE